jgi:pyridoxamine 5'-phosphate oxidase
VDPDLAHLRVEYGRTRLCAADAGDDPMVLFGSWFARARDDDAAPEANAMSLATAAPDGTPSVRMVLLKEVDVRRASFTWYTNLDSRKAREARTTAALCWWWPGTPGRQVRAVGRVEEISREEAAAYFATRPGGARVGAAASEQSRPVASRAELDARAAALDAPTVELPERWGGLRLVADELEFWQGQAGRLHDRIAFLRLDPDSGAIVSAAAAAGAGGAEALLRSGTVVADRQGVSWLRVRLQP